LMSSTGCNYPTLRLISNIIFTENENESLDSVKKIDDAVDIVILNNVPREIQLRWENYSASNGTIEITDFCPNWLKMIVNVPDKNGVWLYYADAFHPAWKAFINDKPTFIAQANVGFKAIKLEQGVNQVKIIYDNKKVKFSYYIIIIASLIFVIVVFYELYKIIRTNDDFPERKSIRRF